MNGIQTLYRFAALPNNDAFTRMPLMVFDYLIRSRVFKQMRPASVALILVMVASLICLSCLTKRQEQTTTTTTKIDLFHMLQCSTGGNAK